jgi:hypothetical protein
VCSAIAGRRIETSLCIHDGAGASMSTLDSNCWALMKMGGDKGSAYYPETLGKLVVVNAPSFF